MEIPPEESTDLEELEQFAKMFKQKRIKLGNLFAFYDQFHLLFSYLVAYYIYELLQDTLKEMLVLQWEKCMATISHKQQFLVLRH